MPLRDHHRPDVQPSGARRDRRVSELVDHIQAHGLLLRDRASLLADPRRTLLLEQLSYMQPQSLRTGYVVYAMPHRNWYRVHVDGITTPIPCTALSFDNYGPLGPRPGHVIAPNNAVLVWLPSGRAYGIIIGSWPLPRTAAKLAPSDWIVQGSMAGRLREDAYRQPEKILSAAGGIIDFAARGPLDATSMEWSRITDLGLGIGIDPFMVWMRVNEMCGIWFNWFDGYTRLAGQNMDIVSCPLEIILRDDEGENRHIEYGSVYPWEAMGMYAPGQTVHAEYTAEDVLYRLPRGAFDLPEGKEDLQSIARYQEHGGYLGQGRHRWVVVPALDTGTRRYADDPAQKPDFGVFEEAIALDGTWAVRSAKQIFITKHCLIPVPKEMRKPEDQKTGDDARKDNYRFSGEFGSGEEHAIGDVKVKGEQAHLLRTAAVLDILAYNYNWKPLHPFHYHKEDYKVPQETDLRNKPGAPSRVQDFLDFGELRSRTCMSAPSPYRVKVDRRYGDVEYFQRQAGIALLPDGGVVIFDGYGATITMTGGNIRFDCPGDVQIMPGRSAVVLGGDDIILRARNSLDATADRRDVTIKAERNLRMLGGNSSQGGVLIESKQPFAAEYKDNVGEDIVSGGIVLKSPKGAVVSLAREIYLRTGGGDVERGRLVLDAAAGNSDLILKGSTVDIFSDNAVHLWLGPHDDSSDVEATYNFTTSGAVLSGYVTVGGGMLINGAILQKGAMINTQGYMAVTGWPMVVPADGEDVNRSLTEGLNIIEQMKTAGAEMHEGIFSSDLYTDSRPGHEATIEHIAFSLRDDGGSQYGTSDFVLLESRWQQMARLGLAGGGTSWGDEGVIVYQGRKQMPYPSKAKWQDTPTLRRHARYVLFDAASGCDADRPGNYVDAEIAALEEAIPQNDYTVIET